MSSPMAFKRRKSMRRKTKNARFIPMVFTIYAASIGIQDTAYANEMASRNEGSMTWRDYVARMKENPPYTGPELWGKVMILISRQNGFMTASDVDAVMGMKLEKFSDFPNGGFGAHFSYYPETFSYLYKINKHTVGGNSVIVKSSHFEINWLFSPDDKKKQCIQANLAFADMTKFGWEVNNNKPDGITEMGNPNHVLYIKRDASVYLSFSGTYEQTKQREPVEPENACVTFIQIDGILAD